MSAYDDLMGYVRQTEALSQVAGRLGWDQETMMSPGSAAQRGEESGAMAAILHARRMAPEVGDWLAAIDPSTLDDVGRAQIRHIQRGYDRAAKVPADLATEIARVTSTAQGIWAEARAAEDYAAFAPTLDQVLQLKRDEAAALAGDGDAYDAMLQDYEPGTTGAELEAMFAAMRPRLVALRERVLGATHQPQPLSGTFDPVKQMALATELARSFGYDFDKGRLDKAVHPFSSGSGQDVRITTRTALDDPFNCFYSTIHEVGHACYEQGISDDYFLTPLGQGVSMGVHESQSRIYENQLGRGRAYTGYLFEKMQQMFGDIGIADAEAFYGTVNRVGSGYIRTEADEIHYNLHVLLRFDLERQLISGALSVADLPEAWNARFEADFGAKVDKPSNGCLQDVHWSVGLFGYFPTYSLGNVYAGCLNEKLRADVGSELEGQLARGETGLATNWLRENLQTHGGLRESSDTIAFATGKPPSVEPLLSYLEDKFAGIYKL